ncbi:cryptococcal mannosyltransferase 1-domain-containing protein [Delphinella strobiligena]|nr:cryptococcal mannosyltransferase 1-domain-containing protein [Delphinella strobiligena]
MALPGHGDKIEAEHLLGSIVFLVLIFALTPLLFSSYSDPPKHYKDLRRRAIESPFPGGANLNNEKVFIATSIYDEGGKLAGGSWGQALADLIHILGPENVFLSVYEDNADELALGALDNLAQYMTCNQSVVVENFNTSSLPKVSLPDDRQRVRRVAFLAEVRNRALRPLEDPTSDAFETTFDKILFVNDVVFDPIDAANLLFSTNIDKHGKTQYRAACALDFIDPFKFYDTFATRDLSGFAVGVPIYPWFSNGGDAQSRDDVLKQKDAVRVRSCWGGMVAFEAKWFQKTTPGGPLRFRVERELWWDASECCLIHADLQELQPLDSYSMQNNATGIYMNPYIRVAYSDTTLRWLSFTRHFERILSPVQKLLSFMANRPPYNPRRLDIAGTEVTDRVWVPSAGHEDPDGNQTPQGGGFKDVTRIASPGGFCGARKLLILGTPDDDQFRRSGGTKKWWGEPIPPDYGR